jgi:hypothetical protein
LREKTRFASCVKNHTGSIKFEKCDFKAFSGVDGGANTSQFSVKELEAAAS